MEAQFISPPRTAMEVFRMLPEGTLCEVINGQLYMAAERKGIHQRSAIQIQSRIFGFLESTDWGEILHAPMDVYLDQENNVVQPDIFIVKKDSACQITDEGFVYGAPEIIIEILSKGNENHDKRVKKDLYEKFGVPEYFIIDPSSKKVVAYTLVNNDYQLKYEEVGVIRSSLLNHTFIF
jgi:Uma2 family endonuclease